MTRIARMTRKVLETKVALAGDHSQVESERWRRIALQTLYVCVGAVGFSLLFLYTPHLDLRATTIGSVIIVAAFLAYTERPTIAAGTSVAPLTAVIAASAVLFGYWTIVLVLVALGAARMRMHSDRSPLAELLSNAYFCQTGAGIIASYGMVAVWNASLDLATALPAWSHIPVAFLGIMAVGMVWQAIQNGLVYVAYALLGRPANTLQFLRIGVIASLYAYLLVALYSFGGFLAAALFYVLVAQTRVVEDIVGITESLTRLDHARVQAISVMRELMRFTDVPDAQFADEVENIAQMLARHMGMSRQDISAVGLAAELHEVGKCRLPARLRFASSPNAAEESQRKTYSRLGALMLRSADALVEPQIADYVEYHTEHYDGTGYPKGLAGEAIPLPARIVAVARAYVCMLTGYDATPKLQKEEALRRLRQYSGTLFDPRLVDLLAELVN